MTQVALLVQDNEVGLYSKTWRIVSIWPIFTLLVLDWLFLGFTVFGLHHMSNNCRGHYFRQYICQTDSFVVTMRGFLSFCRVERSEIEASQMVLSPVSKLQLAPWSTELLRLDYYAQRPPELVYTVSLLIDSNCFLSSIDNSWWVSFNLPIRLLKKC